MEHDKYKEMMVLYSYNELSKDERSEFERHLLGCNSCREELEELKKFHELIKTNAVEELDEDTLFESRQELLAEIRKLNRKKFQFSRIWEYFTTPTSGSLRFAYTLASATIIFAVGYFMLFKSTTSKGQVTNDIAKVESSITNLEFINSDFEKGDVEITYDQITPMKVKGNVNEAEIQKVLAQSLIDSENPGTRLKTVSAILSEKGARTSNMFKEALIKAMMYDDNPGVRKEAMNALCNLQFDDQIRDAMIHVLQSDKNSGLRIQAINCLDVKSDLQKITDPNTINMLKKKMEEDENSYVKLRAKTILTKLES